MISDNDVIRDGLFHEVVEYLNQLEEDDERLHTNDAIIMISQDFEISIQLASELYASWVESKRGIQSDMEC
jgi:hypothetical protein|tara:strand:+ start:207 stop:419 length:213 start_codon:yes stop_codon:yes gene_type:complete